MKAPIAFASSDIEILRQNTGRFDRRFKIGPAIWPFFDLLWIHAGTVELEIASAGVPVQLKAPNAVLLFPDTPFAGRSVSAQTEASICHFRMPGEFEPGCIQPRGEECFALQAMVGLSLRLAREGAGMTRRTRLLDAILDGFSGENPQVAIESRVDRAWRLAGDRLEHVRGLKDVAVQVGLSESAFRAAHRAQNEVPAGRSLTALRIATAEKLLATTPMTLAEVAKAVGYGHAETLSHSFSQAHGISPGDWRRRQAPFA